LEYRYRGIGLRYEGNDDHIDGHCKYDGLLSCRIASPFHVRKRPCDIKRCASNRQRGATMKRLFAILAFVIIIALLHLNNAKADLLTLNTSQILGDTYIREVQPTDTFGTQNYFSMWGKSGGFRRWAFMKWDISSIPSGINITNASLCVRINNVGSNKETKINSVYNQTWGASSQTWNNHVCGTASSWNNSKCNSTSENIINVTVNVFNCYSITQMLYKDYQNGNKNFSVALLPSAIDDDNNFMDCDSNEQATVSKRPYLNITYGSPPPIQYGNITFNVKDNETSLHISNLTISCNNSYVANFSSPLTHEFEYSDYNCSFTHTSYYSNQSIFTVNSNSSSINLTMGEIIYPKNITFAVLDSFTNDDILGILIVGINAGKPSDNFSSTEDSPFNHSFMNKTVFNCDVSKNGYENFSFSINISAITSVTILLDRVGGLTSSEKQKLEQIFFLQSVSALPEELIIQNQTCIDFDTLSTSYNPVYCSNPASCNDVLTYCQFGCDQVNMQCRANPIETGALFIVFILYMAAIIIAPILVLTHHSKKKKRDMIIGIFTFFFAMVIYLITTAFIIPAIANFFGNDYYVTTILVGMTLIIFPLVDLLLFLNNALKDRY
jgi:hypothetical protein